MALFVKHKMLKSNRVMIKIIRTTILFILLPINIFAQSLSFQGQLSNWWGYSNAVQNTAEAGLRYLPEIRLVKPVFDDHNLDLELAINSYTNFSGGSLSNINNKSDARLYRLSGRYYSPRFETRIGLQKINFGPAKVFRSLMWFDRLDPRDPLKLTDGVYAILGRYYFLNNANLWVWGLYGNENTKGLEIVKSDKNIIEPGARCQIPVPNGEIGLSLHRRYLDKTDYLTKMQSAITDGTESRIGIDGVWDIGIGLWFESAVTQTQIDVNNQLWAKHFTLGSDYTFKSGLHLTTEHFINSTGQKFGQNDRTLNYTAVMGDYLLGIIDSLTGILYYDWDQNKGYLFLGWQRSYDNWRINVLTFSNPDNNSTSFGGNGVQLIFTYNH